MPGGPAPLKSPSRKAAEAAEAVPQSFMIEKQALEEYKNAVVEQRNALGAQLEQATASVESEKKAREDLAAKLQMLQGQVRPSPYIDSPHTLVTDSP